MEEKGGLTSYLGGSGFGWTLTRQGILAVGVLPD